MNWRVRNSKKNKYYKTCDNLQLVGDIPRPPETPMGPCLITVKMSVYSIMDESNCMARMKWVEDWLVTRGYLVDDKPSMLHYTAIPTQKVDRKNQGIEISLVEVDSL